MKYADGLRDIMSCPTPVPREHYLSRIRETRDLDLIKVITGIRGCGKSTLLGMYMGELADSGVPDDRMFHVDLERAGGIRTFRDLIDAAKSKVGELDGSYIFLEGVQAIPEWERAVSTFHVRGADVYITGSDSDMLSSKLATKLSGRCLGIRVQPLMFSEYVPFRAADDPGRLLDDYLRYGGLPAVALLMDTAPSLAGDMLEGLYNTVLGRDVKDRHGVRGGVIDGLCGIMMGDIGGRTSARGVAGRMAGLGMRTQPQTIDRYIGYLEEAFLFSRARRLDPGTREYIRTADRFYVADLGLRRRIVPFGPDGLGRIIGNVVHNELVYRYGRVAVYGSGNREVDFIADPVGMPSYYRVAMSITDPVARERVLRPLRAIDDNYPKTVITYDRSPFDDIDGIRVVSLLDWLLEDVRRFPGIVFMGARKPPCIP